MCRQENTSFLVGKTCGLVTLYSKVSYTSVGQNKRDEKISPLHGLTNSWFFFAQMRIQTHTELGVATNPLPFLNEICFPVSELIYFLKRLKSTTWITLYLSVRVCPIKKFSGLTSWWIKCFEWIYSNKSISCSFLSN